MAQKFGDHLDGDFLPKHPGGIGMTEPMRIKTDARLPPEPPHQVMDGGISHCLPVGSGRETGKDR